MLVLDESITDIPVLSSSLMTSTSIYTLFAPYQYQYKHYTRSHGSQTSIQHHGSYQLLRMSLMNSPVHGLYKILCRPCKSPLSNFCHKRHTIDTPSHVKLYLIPIRCMSKSMNIEDVQIMTIRAMILST